MFTFFIRWHFATLWNCQKLALSKVSVPTQNSLCWMENAFKWVNCEVNVLVIYWFDHLMDIFIQIPSFVDDETVKLWNELSFNRSNATYRNVNEMRTLFDRKTWSMLVWWFHLTNNLIFLGHSVVFNFRFLIYAYQSEKKRYNLKTVSSLPNQPDGRNMTILNDNNLDSPVNNNGSKALFEFICIYSA